MRRAVVALAVTAMLAGCGGDDTASSGGGGSGGGGKAAGDVKLSMVTAGTTQNVFVQLGDGAEQAGKVTGTDVSVTGPSQINPEQQVQMFQAATRRTPDGIAYMATAPDVFAQPTSKAVEGGVPVLAVDSAPLPDSGVTTFVGNDNYTLGKSVAEELIKEIPEDAEGEIVFAVDIPGLPLLEARTKGMIDVVKKQRPNVKIVGPLNAGAEPADNYNRLSAMVKAHPDALAFMQPGAQGAVSMAQITQQSGKKRLFAGCDVDQTSLEALKSGAVTVLGDPWHWLKGYIGTTLLAEQAIDGKAPPEGWWNSGSGIVKRDEVDEIIEREKSDDNRQKWFQAEIDKQMADPPLGEISDAT